MVLVGRKPRIHLDGGFYHVILRGNSKQPIFFDDGDRRKWESLLADGILRYDHRIHAYCWMSNHIHMAVQASTCPLGAFVAFVAAGYARCVNRRLGRTGHLFERRYRALLVQADSYLLELVRYIHRNPVRAGITNSPSHYRWSSHKAYATGVGPDWLTRETVWKLFAADLDAARQHYRAFMQEPPSEEVTQVLRSGQDASRSIIGDDDWLQEIAQPKRTPLKTPTLAEIVSRNCKQFSVTEAELRSRSREHRLAVVRAKIASEATDACAASISEVARMFGRSQPAMSRSISRWRARKRL